MIAPTCAECNWFVASAADPQTGALHVLSDLPAGGWGGTPFNDGMHVTMDPLGNCQNLPAETAELLFPVRYNSLRDDHRLGRPRPASRRLRVRLEVEFLGRGQIITMETSRTREGSPGVNGGGRASRQRQLRKTPDGTLTTIGGLDDEGNWHPQMLGNVGFRPGESFVFESGGGGGWGDPFKRDPQSVLEDVRNELVSRERALEIYGVVITDALELDSGATERQRSGAPGT